MGSDDNDPFVKVFGVFCVFVAACVLFFVAWKMYSILTQVAAI